MSSRNIIKLSCNGTFSIDDEPDTLDWNYFNKCLGAWAEIAVKCKANEVESLFGFDPGNSLDDVYAFCDENGYAKRLTPNWKRPWDNHVIVGDMYFCAAREVWTEDGPDIVLRGLDSLYTNGMTNYFMSLGRPLSFEDSDSSALRVSHMNGKGN